MTAGSLQPSTTLASPGGAEICGRNDDSCGVGDRLRQLFRLMWPAKTALHLSAQSGVSVRSAEYLLARDREIVGRELISLLRSDNGYPVLREIMHGSKAKWWRNVQRANDLAELRLRQEQQRRLIERLEREAAD